MSIIWRIYEGRLELHKCLRVVVKPSGVNNSHRLAHSYQLPHPGFERETWGAVCLCVVEPRLIPSGIHVKEKDRERTGEIWKKGKERIPLLIASYQGRGTKPTHGRSSLVSNLRLHRRPTKSHYLYLHPTVLIRKKSNSAYLAESSSSLLTSHFKPLEYH